MGQAIFGAGNKGNPGNTVIGGSSMPRERSVRDVKLSSRIAKSDRKIARDRSDTGKKITGRVIV